jgi:ribose 5-phosphate isomerase B
MKIIIASDHAGVELKTSIINDFPEIKFSDLGLHPGQNGDYPDIAKNLCQNFLQEGFQFGILICGSGMGMSISANRFSSVRAALCFDEKIAKLSREHNNANILCLGARFISQKKAFSIIKSFIEAKFSNGRHGVRIKKIDQFDQRG